MRQRRPRGRKSGTSYTFCAPGGRCWGEVLRKALWGILQHEKKKEKKRGKKRKEDHGFAAYIYFLLYVQYFNNRHVYTLLLRIYVIVTLSIIPMFSSGPCPDENVITTTVHVFGNYDVSFFRSECAFCAMINFSEQIVWVLFESIRKKNIFESLGCRTVCVGTTSCS